MCTVVKAESSPIDQSLDAGFLEGGDLPLDKNASCGQGQFPKKNLAVNSLQSVLPAARESVSHLI